MQPEIHSRTNSHHDAIVASTSGQWSPGYTAVRHCIFCPWPEAQIILQCPGHWRRRHPRETQVLETHPTNSPTEVNEAIYLFRDNDNIMSAANGGEFPDFFIAMTAAARIVRIIKNKNFLTRDRIATSSIEFIGLQAITTFFLGQDGYYFLSFPLLSSQLCLGPIADRTGGWN